MKKQRILIVDDSELNREILAAMLEESYEIYEAEDGMQALEILKKDRNLFKLMLLDLRMPVMDGYQILAVMKEKQWLDTLPVICISSENSEESIRQAYDLGVSDYFVRPFDFTTVLHRVKNTITLHEKMAGGLQDAMGMLSSIFYRIVKVDLTADAYVMLKDIEEGFKSPLDSFTKISERLYAMAANDFIYEDDKAEYLDFCNIDHLRRKFAEGSNRISLNYRTKVNNEFRWVSMEIIRSAEYKPQQQVVMLYVRDINDEYLRQLDMVIRKSRDFVATVSMNLSAGVCLSGSSSLRIFGLQENNEPIDDYIKRIAKYLAQEEFREEFICKFSRENLLKCFEDGHNMITEKYAVYCEEKKFRLFRMTVEMARNSSREQIEAVLYFSDITVKYLTEKIPALLYQKNFDEIAVIDARQRTIGMDSPENFDISKYLENETDYDSYVDEVMESHIPEDEKVSFKRCTQLEIIQKELNENGRYSINVHVMGENGEKYLKTYTYLYLERAFKIIVAAVEDVTEISDQDTLTGGYNRQGFIRCVENILRESENRTQYAILFFNIKNFKAVNELFGLETGDMVLKKIYRDLKKSILHPLAVSRVEADHFTCLIRKQDLNLELLLGLCERKLEKEGKSLHLFFRCGIFYVEEKEMPVNGMIDRAKLAKKYITDEYVQPYKIYDASMKNSYIDKAELAGELEEAIEQEQLKVFYQPVVNPKTGEVVSAEALIRWFHPERGFISPGLFIPALEESGHISELDLYVIKKVNEFQRERYGKGKKVVPVSVNLSWMDFYDETLIKWLKDKCEDDSVPKELCRLEVTETSYAAIEQNRNSFLESLRNSGIEILLDDFGSGYSFFGMLQKYNFDIMKLDMSFVRQIETNAKTRSIIHFMIDMAHEMGIRLVAEGAETQEQVDFLRDNGCDYIQGYYYYKPLPQEEFVQVLDEA